MSVFGYGKQSRVELVLGPYVASQGHQPANGEKWRMAMLTPQGATKTKYQTKPSYE